MPDENQSVLAAIMSLSGQVAAIDKSLAINTTETTNVKEQLIKLNGKVATHESSIGLNGQAIALLTQTLTSQQNILEKITANQDEKQEKSMDWKTGILDKAGWGILIFLGIILYTLLVRTNTLAPLNTLSNSQPQPVINSETK